jgi:Sulfotransferase family
MTQYVVITGCRRSGTTLLQAMLAQHPGLSVHPKEPQFILEGYDRFGDLVKQIPKAVEYVTSHPYCSEKVTRTNFNAALQDRQTIEYRDFINCYLDLWGGDTQKSIVRIIKDPAFIYNLDRVTRFLPGASVIQIVRDPRGSISSQLARWKNARLWECLRRWQNAIDAGHRWGLAHKHAYLEIRYEDLVSVPDLVVQRLCDFLQVEFIREMLTFELVQNEYSSGTISKTINYRAVDPTRLEIWREKLAPPEVVIIERKTKEEMLFLNYPQVHPEASLLRVEAQIFKERLYYGYLLLGRWVKKMTRMTFWWLQYRMLSKS